jgi:ribosomal protein S18 acetylase RimI-like enzyme
MPPFEIRPFQRSDREQLTALVNAHIDAVIPGCAVSVNTVLSQLERESSEYVVDPWVIDRSTLVAVERERVVGAAHLLRYAADERVSDSYRNVGEIRWLVCWPDTEAAGDELAAAAVAEFERWIVDRQYADGSLPAPAVYGVPENWPHVRAIYRRGGFEHTGHVEIVYVAQVADLPRSTSPPFAGLAIRRQVGTLATLFRASAGGETVGFVEIDTDLTEPGLRSRGGGWADIGNLHVAVASRRRGIATWMLGHAADWLRLGRVERVLAYARPEETDEIAFLRDSGFRELTRTARGWSRSLAVAGE